MNHVTIDLEVLCSFVKDQVRRDVKSIPVVVVKDWRARTLNMHVLKQEGEPLKLTSYCCQCPILRLGGGMRDESSESLRKKQYLDTDLRVLEQSAQSVSLNPKRW